MKVPHKQLLSILTFLFLSQYIIAQNDQSTTTKKYDKTMGFGVGLDYGGIGGQLTVSANKNIGIFGGFGYAFAGIGYNIGAKYRLKPFQDYNKLRPYLTTMYGYNAVVYVSDCPDLSKFFYGPSIGFGLDYSSHPTESLSHWSFALFLPIRKSNVQDYINNLRYEHNVKFSNNTSSLTASLGYHF